MAGRTRAGVRSGLRRRLVAAAGATLLLTGATACSDDGGDDKTGLAHALSVIGGTGPAATHIEFADVQALLAANGGTDRDGPYARLIGYGFPALRDSLADVPGVYGFDPLKADLAWSVGTSPDQAAVLEGTFDLQAATDKIKAAGGTPLAQPQSTETLPATTTRWRIAPDHEIDLAGSPLPHVLDAANVIEASADGIAYTSYADGLAQVTGRTRPLAGDDAVLGGLGDCLGDVLTAEFGNGHYLGGPRWYAVGVRGAKGEAPTEVLCVKAATERIAEEVTGKLRTAVAGNRPDGRPWGEVLSGAEVEQVGDTVRLTARPAANRPAGVLHQAFAQGALPGATAPRGGS